MRNDKIQLVFELFDSFKDKPFNMNSIVFTTIIKGFVNQQKFNDALIFFNKIKHRKELPGMVITYNCALDIYSNNLNI